MPSQRNLNELKFLKEKLDQAKSVILADYKGLKVAQLNSLRNTLKTTGAESKVSKNTLLKLAFRAKEFKFPEENKIFSGPTLIIFSLKDEVSPLKTVVEFSQNTGLPKFKAGFLGATFLTAERLKELAKLPDRPMLLGQLAGTLNAPLAGLTSVLKGNLNKLILSLKALENIKKNKS
jgi:large subunit ribosomal protein L10